MTVNNEGGPNSIEFYRDQVARIVTGSGKIADITHADTNEHSMALPAGYPANTRAIIIRPERVTGTGLFICRQVTGITFGWTIASAIGGVWVRAADGLFYYNLTVANDDWDIRVIAIITGAP